MKNLESPAEAESKQRRKLAYLPPVWPLLAIVVVVVVIAIIASH